MPYLVRNLDSGLARRDSINTCIIEKWFPRCGTTSKATSIYRVEQLHNIESDLELCKQCLFFESPRVNKIKSESFMVCQRFYRLSDEAFHLMFVNIIF